VAPILGVLLLGLRYRRSRATGQNLRLPLLMVSLFVMLPIANGLVQFGLLDRDTFVALFLIVFSLVTASLAIGLMRYRLFDVELVVRRSLVYGIAWATIAAVYVGLAAAFGLATALRYQVAIAILVAIAATIVFQPARVWLERVAGRLVFGRRLGGYELLRDLGDAFDRTLELESAGPLLAIAVAEGLQANWVRVYVGRDSAAGPTFELAGQAGQDQRPAIDQGPLVGDLTGDQRPGTPHLVAVDDEGDEGHQHRDRHDVVASLAGLGEHHHSGVEDQRRSDQRRRSDAVGPSDAPSGKQPDRKPSEVEQWREEVVVDDDDPNPVDQLRSRGVKPDHEPHRVGEVQVHDRRVLREPSRERHVVPGGVAAEHPLVEAELRGKGPLGDRERGDRDCDQ
jgi:hypothetical protein